VGSGEVGKFTENQILQANKANNKQD